MSTLTNYNGLQIVTPNPAGPGGLAINKNFKALSTRLDTADPTSASDATQGFVPGSRWFNVDTTAEWICTDNTAGAAQWQAVNAGGCLPLSGGTLTGTLNLSGNLLNMNDGSGSSGGTLNMDHGAIENTYLIQAPNAGLSYVVTLDPTNLYLMGTCDTGDGNRTSAVIILREAISDTISGNIVIQPGTGDSLGGGNGGDVIFRCVNPGTVKIGGCPVHMNDGSGSGGGPLDLEGGQIVQMRADNQSSAPSSPNLGQIYFDTSDNHFYGWNGTAWAQLDN